MECKSLALENPLQFAPHLAIQIGGDFRQHFKNTNFGTQPQPDRSQFQADIAAAHDTQVFGHRVQFQGVGGADDILTVKRQIRQRHAFAAGGQNNRPGR